MYFVYTLLGLVYCVALVPKFVYEALRHRKYIGGLGERLGYLPVSFNVDGERSVWIHAVSVGEVLTARSIMDDLRRLYPGLRLFVSTTTVAGQQVARSSVPAADAVFYFPLDLPFIVRRVFRLARPSLFIMMETEIWPNLLRAARARGVRTLLVNGRISSRSYPRYRLVRRWFRRVLADVDHCLVQSEATRDRLVDLGADPSRITVTGSLKFDSLPAATGQGARRADRVLRFFRTAAGRPVIVAGSTLRGEESILLSLFERIRATRPSALMVIAPRHPERFGEVERLARDAGFDTTRRSDLVIDSEPTAEVVILDTIGELASLYQVATVVFVGGSLVTAGGHNILEPAAHGKPVVFGPHMENFSEIAEAFLSKKAAVQVRDGEELEAAVNGLLDDEAERERLGRAALAVVESNRGARDRTLEVIERLMPPESVNAAGAPQLRLVR
ncbi:MAG: 3-deoxy-D-manno-octulosonic acid transferase [Vicinamibacterales bacterium]